MGPGTGRSGGPRATPADTLRQLAGDISNFLNSVPTGQDLLVRDLPRAVENNASALAELFLGMLPGSGDAIAVRDAADFSGKTVDALRGGRFGDAAGNFGLTAASAAGALPFVPHLAGIVAGKGAKTADLVALQRAEDMRRKGVPPRIDRMAQETAQDQTYKRTAGEVEARDVQSRADFAPDQRAATAPYTSQGIAPEDMIVLNRGGGVQASEDLPGDTASRMARAKDQGWVGGYYRYEAPGVGRPTEFPSGGHFTDDPEYVRKAKEAGQYVGEYMLRLERPAAGPMSYSDIADIVSAVRSEIGESRARDILRGLGLPENVAAGIPLDRFVDLAKGRGAEVAADASQMIQLLNRLGDARKFLGEAGFDAMPPRTGNVSGWEVIPGNKVRSVDAQFDPDKKDSGNLLASFAALLGMGGAAAAVDPTTSQD
jgi:hypothetical protein